MPAAGLICLAWLFVLSMQDGYAQETEPAPGEIRTLYLPFLSAEEARPQVLSGHGEWPSGRSYIVRENDTLLSVALEMAVDLVQISCLISPDFSWEQPLVIGDTLRVPETPFACHQVQAGETLANIAEQYDVNPALIAAEIWNQLDGEPEVGHYLRVPLSSGRESGRIALDLDKRWDGNETQLAVGPGPHVGDVPSVPADWPYGSGEFAWPTYGWITQGYRLGHSAIDIAAYQGTPVTASDRGVVMRAGWSTVGYGQYVVIDHNIDYITLYAHLSEIYVAEGDVVAKGQLLGRVGSTGNSTGPHLHFEIRDFGTRIDPLSLLPR